MAPVATVIITPTTSDEVARTDAGVVFSVDAKLLQGGCRRLNDTLAERRRFLSPQSCIGFNTIQIVLQFCNSWLLYSMGGMGSAISWSLI